MSYWPILQIVIEMTEQEVAQAIKEQVDRLELIKIINVYSLNVDVKKMKR